MALLFVALKSLIMKSYPILCLFFSLLVSFGCGSTKHTKTTTQISNQEHQEEEFDAAVSLADHLSRLPGVRVIGRGRDAQVVINGISSFNGSNEPLFVVNGKEMPGGLKTVSQLISVADIKSINVLKTISETGFYGVRGANGVIEITLKN